MRYLPHALVATAFVVLLPGLVVWAMFPSGSTLLLIASIPLAMALSVGAATAGSAFWQRRPGSSDVVFADLMLWGWLRRMRAERRLAEARTVLGQSLSPGRRVEALERLTRMLEARDAYTHGHARRVARHAERIATAMHLSPADVARVRTAAALHDIGKLRTPRELLNKAGRLTDEEFAVVRRHPGDGADMVAEIGDPAIEAMIRHHHERLDGGGYPDRLAGAEIPVGARIIAVADTFDAMTSTRSYRKAARHKKALCVLEGEAGLQLDPRAVSAFVSYYSGRRSIAWSALATTVPQRFFTWLGSATPAFGAGSASSFAQVLPAISAVAMVASVPSPSAAPDTRRPATREAPSANVRVVPASAKAAGRTAPGDLRSGSAPVARRPGQNAVRDNSRAPARRSPVTRRRSKADKRIAPTRRSPGHSNPDGAPGIGAGPKGKPEKGPKHTQSPSGGGNGSSKPEPTPTPTAEVPGVELPPIEVGPVKVHGVKSPSIKVPPVKVPHVEVPEVELPAVELPKVEVDVPLLEVELP